ncbi:MAG: hypothetical protein DLM50_06175 [Candidatus Meridianibacter frigidus]|nr:MAG: hypothetical protein DLM50_06175 [Candidatus Eremiobacteraeota bacterium]
MIIVLLLTLMVLLSYLMADAASEGLPVRIPALHWENPQFLGILIFLSGTAMCSIVVFATAIVIHVRTGVILGAFVAGASLLASRAFSNALSSRSFALLRCAAIAGTTLALVSILRA